MTDSPHGLCRHLDATMILTYDNRMAEAATEIGLDVIAPGMAAD